MLKRRGNFPYDFDAAYPAYPTPVMPPNYVPIPLPPPAPPLEPAPLAPPPTLVASPDPAPGASSAPVPSSVEVHPSTPSPKSPPRRRRRSSPLDRSSSQNLALAAPPPNESEASRHSRKCTVCHHPDRATIEDDFVNWINLVDISIEFDVPEISIRRHARATGLYQTRRAKYHAALDLIIEDAGRIVSTGDTIIRAIRAASCLDESVRWVEPPKRVIFTTEHDYAPALPLPTETSALPPAPDFRTFSSRQGTAELVPSDAEEAVPKSPPNSGVLTPEVEEIAAHPIYETGSIENPILELPPPPTNEPVLIDPGDD